MAQHVVCFFLKWLVQGCICINKWWCYTNTLMCACTQTHWCAHKCTHTHARAHACTQSLLCIWVEKQDPSRLARPRNTHRHSHMHMVWHTRTCTCTHMHVHTYTVRLEMGAQCRSRNILFLWPNPSDCEFRSSTSMCGSCACASTCWALVNKHMHMCTHTQIKK